MTKPTVLCAIMLLFAVQAIPAFAQQRATDTSANPKSSHIALPEDSVVVSQGGAQVTLQDVDGLAEALPWDQRAAVFSDPHRIERILRELLLTKQLVNDAKADGLDQDPIVRAGMELASRQALAKARVQAFTEATQQSVPDLTELAHERYLAKPEEFAVPARTDVKHILIGTKDRSDAEAKALAEKIYAALLKNPSEFDDDVA